MLGHLGINVPDLGAAKNYYGVIMPLLEFEPYITGDHEFAYRPIGGKPGTYLFFYLAIEKVQYSRDRTGLQHLAFIVRSRTAVNNVHLAVSDLASKVGGRVLHEPRHFPEYPPPYYATFWLDPWGFMLEAVCHHDNP